MAALAAAAAFMAPGSRAESVAGVIGSACVHAYGDITRYCGPATARLSVFRGVVFSGGSCGTRSSGGVRLLTIRIGARSRVPSTTNDGLTLFTLQLSGPPTHPTSGLVVVYVRSRHWQGRTVSFRRGAHATTFLAQAVFPSKGRATGSYRCLP